MDALRLGIAPSPSVVASLLYFIQQHRIPRGKELCTPFSNTITFAFLSLMKTPFLTIPYTNTSFARTNSSGEEFLNILTTRIFEQKQYHIYKQLCYIPYI